MGITPTTWSSSQRLSISGGTRLFTLLFTLFFVLSSAILSAPSRASKNGTELRDNLFAVGFTYLDDGVSKICSSVLIAPRVLVSARHCAQNDTGSRGTNYELTPPAISLEAATDPRVRLPKVERIIVPGPSEFPAGSSGGDIAFFILDIPFSRSIPLAVAGQEQLGGLTDASEIHGYGFGAVFESGASYSPYVRRYPLSWKGSFVSTKDKTIYELSHPVSTACRGDSGGPITTKLSDGSEVLLGVLSGAADVAESCGGLGSDGLYQVRFTIVQPYLFLVSEYSSAAKPSPSPTPKVKRIVCVKGTKKVIVRAVNPKCPKGYRKR